MDLNEMPPPPPPPPPPRAGAMASLPPAPAPSTADLPGTELTLAQKIKRAFAPLGVVLLLMAKFFGKVKFLILPVLKFLPVILKTGGTMLLSIGVYALRWGIWFAVGFVLLMFVHECGHLLAARRIGLKVSAPVFIPFMGAFILLKEAPRNAWIEAQVGIGGPLLGALGAGVCELIYLVTGNLMFRALAHVGFFLNLFNLTPIGFLDGGRIVTALSPWLWLVGFAVMLAMTVNDPTNFLLILILIASLPRLFSVFRKKSETEQRYFEISPVQRWTIGVMYFGLIALLVLGMSATWIPHDSVRPVRAASAF